MTNISRPDELGPLPAAAVEETPSRARSHVLDTLRAAPTPLTLAELSAQTGLHVNTLRDHLETLVATGQVRRTRAQPHGRGRPALLFSASGRRPTSAVAEYAGLAGSLAEVISRTSSRPWDDATQAGATWGRTLVPPGEVSVLEAEEQVVDLLADLRFAPEREGDDVRLTRCPLLEAAKRFPDVVCGVHLGIVQGVLEQLGTDGSGTVLHPFAEPGACRLSFRASQA